MSNKTRLQTNNTNLQALITKANNLPDAGAGGGGFQTYSVTVNASALSGLYALIVGYTKPDGTYYEDVLGVTGRSTQTYTDVSGGLLLYDGMLSGLFSHYMPSYDGGVVPSMNGADFAIFNVTGNGTITLG